jgi:hypothetical protein
VASSLVRAQGDRRNDLDADLKKAIKRPQQRRSKSSFINITIGWARERLRDHPVDVMLEGLSRHRRWLKSCEILHYLKASFLRVEKVPKTDYRRVGRERTLTRGRRTLDSGAE